MSVIIRKKESVGKAILKFTLLANKCLCLTNNDRREKKRFIGDKYFSYFSSSSLFPTQRDKAQFNYSFSKLCNYSSSLMTRNRFVIGLRSKKIVLAAIISITSLKRDR